VLVRVGSLLHVRLKQQMKTDRFDTFEWESARQPSLHHCALHGARCTVHCARCNPRNPYWPYPLAKQIFTPFSSRCASEAPQVGISRATLDRTRSLMVYRFVDDVSVCASSALGGGGGGGGGGGAGVVVAAVGVEIYKGGGRANTRFN
jgi:hypothetical protein